MESFGFRSLSQMCAAVLVIVMMATQPSYAADGYSITPLPNWVSYFGPGTVSEDSDDAGGERYLLLDRQIYEDGTIEAYHSHSIVEVVGQAGLSDNSNLSISFDPNYQRLELHSATVTRDGQTSDRLADARVDIARTEDSTHLDLLNGELTALVVLPDVRVGDTVETRYTVYGRNPVFEKRHHSQWRVRWRAPVERSIIRITVPAADILYHSPEQPTAEYSENVNSGLRTLQWVWNKGETSEAEPDTTRWMAHPDVLQVSEFENWTDVANWGAGLFAGHSAEGDKYQKLVKFIRKTKEREGLDAAIAASIDYVQQRVRYYGIELGVNSHRPHAPDEVLKNGYGDCKDKALLLISLLNELGVDAWPILVSTRIRNGLTHRLPSPGVFNHVVVLVEHEGEQHWVDATDNSQSGLLGLRGQPEYGSGLVLGMNSEGLIEREAPMPELPGFDSHDKFYLSSFGGPVDFETTTTYRGRSANSFRRRLDETGKRTLGKQYEDYYSEIYGKLSSLKALQVKEDEQNNTIVVTESYRLNEFWEIDKRTSQAEFEAYALGVNRFLDDFEDVKSSRKAPITVNGPAKVSHRIQYFPNIASPERALEETTFSSDGFSYSDAEYILGDSFVFDSQLEISTQKLLPKQMKDYKKFLGRVGRNARSGRFFPTLDTKEVNLGKDTTELLKVLGDIN